MLGCSHCCHPSLGESKVVTGCHFGMFPWTGHRGERNHRAYGNHGLHCCCWSLNSNVLLPSSAQLLLSGEYTAASCYTAQAWLILFSSPLKECFLPWALFSYNWHITLSEFWVYKRIRSPKLRSGSLDPLTNSSPFPFTLWLQTATILFPVSMSCCF